MKASTGRELIIVRSLTESDLGLFAAHRQSARSKQRAININSTAARQLLSPDLFARGGGPFECLVVFGDARIRGSRHFGKTHKNWRLGGNKIEGEAFAKLDCKDFMLIRSVAGNDGTHPLFITFVCRSMDPVVHAGLVAIVERVLDRSMVVFEEGSPGFSAISKHCPSALNPDADRNSEHTSLPVQKPERKPVRESRSAGPFPPMPRDEVDRRPRRPLTIGEKLRSPYILERMLHVASDLSAPQQLKFMDIVEKLASQLRQVLLATGGIVSITKNHAALWKSVAGKEIGFVDGGLANLSMLGSAPIAARVGGYVVKPGEHGPARERFTVLKQLIDELYANPEGGVYDDSFPDIGALRDAARISIEAAGAVRLLAEHPELAWIMLHGALVNPVSRYTDVMRDGRVQHAFPDFSDSALRIMLPPGEPERTGRDRNFISVHLRQLELLQQCSGVVCGVIERESNSISVCRAVLESLNEDRIRDLLPVPPAEWKHWFLNSIDPSGDDESEGQRITDSLLFRCLLEPGEALLPIPVDRNEMRRAPEAWKSVITRYPKPWVSYLQATEWSAPIRIEIFEKDVARFEQTASLIMHCAMLLPRYAFPVGLDIVDKFARMPNWMSRPVNTHTVVQALKRALDQGETGLFDALRRMLCGSSREWLLRPSAIR